MQNSDSSAKIACSGNVADARVGKLVAGKSRVGTAGEHRHRNQAGIAVTCTCDLFHS